jgi:hypothetical protein
VRPRNNRWQKPAGFLPKPAYPPEPAQNSKPMIHLPGSRRLFSNRYQLTVPLTNRAQFFRLINP